MHVDILKQERALFYDKTITELKMIGSHFDFIMEAKIYSAYKNNFYIRVTIVS